MLWVEDKAMWPFAIEYAPRPQNIPSAEKKKVPRLRGNKTSPSRVILQMEAFVPHAPTFETLMLPHLDAAYNLARWLLRDPHDAQDAVQDAFLRAHRSFERFRGTDGRPWLLTIVRNVCYSKMRETNRGPEEVAFAEDVHGSTHDPADANAVAWHEVKGELLQKALERLPAPYREVIVLHEIEGLPYRSIAAVTGTPVGTVMSRLSRARARLQAEVVSPTEKAQP
jgi:RNA polymerase sigma-70 factor, ECF subfamily